MARGPKPQPAAVKRQRGSSRRPIVEEAAPVLAAAAGGVEPPSWMTSAGAVEIWNRLAPVLVQARLLTAADAQAFGRYCRNFADWLKVREQMDKEGATYESDSNHGKLKRAHPAFLIADRLERQLLAAEDRFGLNPAERQRIFAARAASGVSGDLFAPEAAPRREGDPATPAAEPAKPIEGPIGLLN